MLEILKKDLVRANEEFLRPDHEEPGDYHSYVDQYGKGKLDELAEDAQEKKRWDDNKFKIGRTLKKMRTNLDR